MMNIAATVIMWALTICLLLFRPRKKNHSMTWASAAIAASVTLNINEVYIAFDKLVGGHNFGDLLSNLALILGVFFLARAISHVYDYSNRAIRALLGPASLIITVIVMIGSFAWIDDQRTSTTFMIDYGDQLGAAIYSSVQYLYFGIVLACMARISYEQNRIARGYQRVSTGSLLIGSIVGLALCGTVIAMDITHLLGAATVLYWLQWAYDILRLLTFLLLGFGFAGPPVIRWSTVRYRGLRTRQLIRQLMPTWRAAVAVRPGVTLGDPTTARAESKDAILHRVVVEIRDAMIDPTASFELSPRARALVETAESHLLHGAGGVTVTTA